MSGDLDLRQRFEELREEEHRVVPPFRASRRLRPDSSARRWMPVTVAALLLIVSVSVLFSMRSRRASFTSDDRIAAHAIADWRPPTEFLLRTPGSELLTSMPSIPDGAVRSLVQSSKGVSR